MPFPIGPVNISKWQKLITDHPKVFKKYVKEVFTKIVEGELKWVKAAWDPYIVGVVREVGGNVRPRPELIFISGLPNETHRVCAVSDTETNGCAYMHNISHTLSMMMLYPRVLMVDVRFVRSSLRTIMGSHATYNYIIIIEPPRGNL